MKGFFKNNKLADKISINDQLTIDNVDKQIIIRPFSREAPSEKNSLQFSIVFPIKHTASKYLME